MAIPGSFLLHLASLTLVIWVVLFCYCPSIITSAYPTLSFPPAVSIKEDVNSTAYPILLSATSNSTPITWNLLYATPSTNAFDLTFDPNTGICSFGYNVTKNGGVPMFDYQTDDYYHVYILVNDSLHAVVTGILNVTIIQVIDPPSISFTGGRTSITENTAPFTYLDAIAATDPQGFLPLNYRISNVLPFSADSGQYFHVNPSGVVFTSATATFNYSAVTEWVVYVDVYNSGLPPATSTYSLTVSILQVGHPPTIDNLPDTISMPEDTTPGTSIFQIRTTDPDGDTVFTYSFDSSPITGTLKFTITSTGTIFTTHSPFNHTLESIYRLRIYLVDSGVAVPATITGSLTIGITGAVGSTTTTVTTTTTTVTTTAAPSGSATSCVGFCVNTAGSSGSSASSSSSWVIPVAVIGGLLGVGALALVLYCIFRPQNSTNNSQFNELSNDRFNSRTPPPAYSARNQVQVINDPNSVYK